MTHLYLLRHGIAVPHGEPGISEEDRPLTPEGAERIKQVARGLKRLDLELDRIVTSPLVRALRTAEIVAETLDLAGALEVSDSLRADREAATIRDWLRTRTEARLMLVGHNPSLTDLIGLLIGGDTANSPGELRKGGIAALSSSPGSRMRLEWLARPRLFRRLG